MPVILLYLFVLAVQWTPVAATPVRVFGSTSKQSVFQYSSDSQSKIIDRYTIVFSVIGGVILLFAIGEIIYTIYVRRSFAKVGVLDQAMAIDAAKRDTETGEESKAHESDYGGGNVHIRDSESTYTDTPQANRRRAKLVVHKHSSQGEKMDIRVERHDVQTVATTPHRDNRLGGEINALVSNSNPSSPQGRKRRVMKMKMSKDGKIDSSVMPV